MPAITIRDVPSDTRDALAARAASKGQSLQEYLHSTLVDMATRPDIADLISGARARKPTSNASVTTDAILEHLDTGRR